jgi:hypothetical protein
MLPGLRALSKWTQVTPHKPTPKPPAKEFRLVKQETHFNTSDQVKRFLPDILGRALARCWIDRGFMTEFLQDPKGVLASYAVFLPENVTIEIETIAVPRHHAITKRGNPSIATAQNASQGNFETART